MSRTVGVMTTHGERAPAPAYAGARAGTGRAVHADHAAEEPRLQLPADLVSELEGRGAAPRTDLRVEGWKPSLLERLLELAMGRRRTPAASR